ncbi:Hachiman antiphage defense system protein HamA, partial [Arundinibacter roseus]
IVSYLTVLEHIILTTTIQPWKHVLDYGIFTYLLENQHCIKSIPILLLHECEITQKQKVISDNYRNEIIAFHKKRAESYFKKQITKIGGLPMYSKVKFHLILFPVPLKKVIIDKFVSIADFYKKN